MISNIQTVFDRVTCYFLQHVLHHPIQWQVLPLSNKNRQYIPLCYIVYKILVRRIVCFLNDSIEVSPRLFDYFSIYVVFF